MPDPWPTRVGFRRAARLGPNPPLQGSRAHAQGASEIVDALGRLFGEVQFEQTTQGILGGIEDLLFGSCVVGALVVTREALTPRS